MRLNRKIAAPLLAAFFGMTLPAGGEFLAGGAPFAWAASANGGAPGDDALPRLKGPKAEERARAASELGERGMMANTPALAALLHDPEEPVRNAAHDALWRIWMRSGDPEVDAVMARGVALMNGGEHEGAIRSFAEIILRRPDFAEGWNKRATAYYLAEKYRESIADCNKTLELNPHHFGALFGLGLNYVGLGDLELAVDSFERTLKVIPFSRGARRYIKMLNRILSQKGRKKI
ncbi:MAG: tetratricopeptide repeat protein [bacterium]